MINIVKADSNTVGRTLMAEAYKITPHKDNPNWTLVFIVTAVPPLDSNGDYVDPNPQDVVKFEVQIDCGQIEPQIKDQDYS